MKKWISLWVCLMLLFTACEHRELSDPNTGHYLRIYVDENIKNVTCGFYDESLTHPEYKRPRVMRVVLAAVITSMDTSVRKPELTTCWYITSVRR